MSATDSCRPGSEENGRATTHGICLSVKPPFPIDGFGRRLEIDKITWDIGDTDNGRDVEAGLVSVASP